MTYVIAALTVGLQDSPVSHHQQRIFETRALRFWGVLFPGTAAFVTVQAHLSAWAFRVFAPNVDGVLRAVFGYGALMLALTAVLILIVVYLREAKQSFEIVPAGLLIRQPGRAAITMGWKDLRVHQRRQNATFDNGRRRVSTNRFFLPELPHLCELLELARRHKRESPSYLDLRE